MSHTAAIHVLKAQLHLADGDYRYLLKTLTGQDSCKALSDAQQLAVRTHMQGLAARQGVPAAKQHKAPKRTLTAMERKVWALWYGLEKQGRIAVATSSAGRLHALRAFIKRQTHCDDLAFCDWAQQMRLIEALKAWGQRGAAEPAPVASYFTSNSKPATAKPTQAKSTQAKPSQTK